MNLCETRRRTVAVNCSVFDLIFEIHLNNFAVTHPLVKFVDDALRFVARIHLDEGIAFAQARVPVDDHIHSPNCSARFEQMEQFPLAHLLHETTDEQKRIARRGGGGGEGGRSVRLGVLKVKDVRGGERKSVESIENVFGFVAGGEKKKRRGFLSKESKFDDVTEGREQIAQIFLFEFGGKSPYEQFPRERRFVDLARTSHSDGLVVDVHSIEGLTRQWPVRWPIDVLDEGEVSPTTGLFVANESTGFHPAYRGEELLQIFLRHRRRKIIDDQLVVFHR